MFKFLAGVAFGGGFVWLFCKCSEIDVPSGVVVEGMPSASPEAFPIEYAHQRASSASYQTAPLTDYRSDLQSLAEDTFQHLCISAKDKLTPTKYKGSYSFLDRSNRTNAKIIIYQAGFGHENGDFPHLEDGVYLLLRSGSNSDCTLGVAPRHQERFTYARVNQDELDEVAGMLNISKRNESSF